MSSTKRGSKRSPADNYPSPIWTINRFLDVFYPKNVEALVDRPWLEPGAGEGNLIRGAQTWFNSSGIVGPEWDANEIRPECREYLEDLNVRNISIGDYLVQGPPTQDQYGMIVTNPPFYLAMDFIRRSLEENTRFVTMLQRINFLGSAKRHPFMEKCPPDLYVLPNRPSFKFTGATDSIEYAWFVWDTLDLSSSGSYFLLGLTSKEERKLEHDRLNALGIFPEIED